MPTAKPIEFADQRHEFFFMNKKNYRLHYSHDERVPKKLRGKPVSVSKTYTIHNVSGTPVQNVLEYEEYKISRLLRPVLPMRRSCRYKVHRLNHLFFNGTEPPVVHHKRGAADNGPSDIVGSTPRHNVWEYLTRKSSATAPYVISTMSKKREVFIGQIKRHNVSYRTKTYRSHDDAMLSAAILNVIVDGPDRAHPPYVDMLYARDLMKDALQHRRDGTFPDFVRSAYNSVERKAETLNRRK